MSNKQQQIVVTRGAIVGTAPTWKNTPWDEPNDGVPSLSDAYAVQGFQRASGWFDLYPTLRSASSHCPDRGVACIGDRRGS